MLDVVEPAVVEVVAEPAVEAVVCSEVVGVGVGVAVDGVVSVAAELAAFSGAALVGVEPTFLFVDEAVVLVCPVSEPAVLVLAVPEVAFCDSVETVLLLPEVEDRWFVVFAAAASILCLSRCSILHVRYKVLIGKYMA